MIGFAKEILLYLYARKKWWLIPILVVFFCLSLFAFIFESSAVLPFIYAMF